MRECAGRGGDGIVVALKDMLLQVLLAGSAVFLIPLFRLVLSKRVIARMEHAGIVHTSFAVTSALSMLLCLLFALYASPVAVPISLSIVPVILVILYCKSAIGVTLSILHILFYFLLRIPMICTDFSFIRAFFSILLYGCLPNDSSIIHLHAKWRSSSS